MTNVTNVSYIILEVTTYNYPLFEVHFEVHFQVKHHSFVNSWKEYCKWVLQFTKLKGICVLLGLEINIMFTERMKVSMVSKNERSAYACAL